MCYYISFFRWAFDFIYFHRKFRLQRLSVASENSLEFCTETKCKCKRARQRCIALLVVGMQHYVCITVIWCVEKLWVCEWCVPLSYIIRFLHIQNTSAWIGLYVIVCWKKNTHIFAGIVSAQHAVNLLMVDPWEIFELKLNSTKDKHLPLKSNRSSAKSLQISSRVRILNGTTPSHSPTRELWSRVDFH